MKKLIIPLILSLLLPVQSWAAIAFGTGGAVANGTTGLSVAFPATIAAGNLLVLCVVNKYPTNGPSLPTDAFGGEWVAPPNGQGTADPGDGPGVDVGATYATIFYKVATGTEDGQTLTVVITSGNTTAGKIDILTNATGTWSIAAANGGDSSSGTAWLATMNADPEIQGGDMVLVCNGRNSDAGTATLQVVATTGVTYGAAVERNDVGSSGGDDIGLMVSSHPADSGTSLAAPVYTFTNTTNVAGGTAMLRMRETTVGMLQSSPGFLGSILK